MMHHTYNKMKFSCLFLTVWVHKKLTYTESFQKSHAQNDWDLLQCYNSINILIIKYGPPIAELVTI